MTQISIERLTYQDLLRPDVLEDPYPLFRRLRDESPVHEDAADGAWIVSRHRDIAFVPSDPRFPNPDTLDLRLRDTGTMSFGHCIHISLGAMLARLEAQIAFAELARRFPTAVYDSHTLERNRSISFRGLRRLDVMLS